MTHAIRRLALLFFFTPAHAADWAGTVLDVIDGVKKGQTLFRYP